VNGGPEPGPRNVLTALPAPVPGTVRRTVSLAVTPDPTWDKGLVVEATARDLLVGPDAVGRVVDTCELTVVLDAHSRITDVSGALPAAIVAGLIGAPAVSGFRARLASSGADPNSLTSAILDDLPTVRLISGYAAMMERPQVFSPSDRRSSPMVDICTGWAAGATADRRVRAGATLLATLPPAPALTAMTTADTDFHREPAARPGSMRRRRILDVTPRGDTLDVFEYFRDSHLGPLSRESSLHEYVVRATASADSRVLLRTIDVEPRALPFPECPLASDNATDLVGTSLAEVTTTVRNVLSGTRGCTHLNDVLRFLRYVPALCALAGPG
jgi:hypothetical protein